jgi:hypothetical protein
MLEQQKKSLPKFGPNDEQLLISAYTEGIIDYSHTATQAVTALSCYPKYTEFLERFSVKKIQNAIGRIKAKSATPEDLYAQERQRLNTRNVITEQFG